MSLKMKFIASALMCGVSVANAQPQPAKSGHAYVTSKQALSCVVNNNTLSAQLQKPHTKSTETIELGFTLAGMLENSNEGTDFITKMLDATVIAGNALNTLKSSDEKAYAKKIADMSQAYENCKILLSPYIALAENLEKQKTVKNLNDLASRNLLLMNIPQAAPSPAGK